MTTNISDTFIGSSSEALDLAHKLQYGLRLKTRGKVWDQGVFGLGWATVEALLVQAQKVDFAILILSADDITISRGLTQNSARDNVVFELGLCMAHLGPKRTFVLYERGADIKILSDLSGLTLADYDGEWAKKDPAAAIGAACEPIRVAIDELGPIERAPTTKGTEPLGDDTWGIATGKWQIVRKHLVTTYQSLEEEPGYIWSVRNLQVPAVITFDVEFPSGYPNYGMDLRLALFAKGFNCTYKSGRHLLALLPWGGNTPGPGGFDFRIDEMNTGKATQLAKAPLLEAFKQDCPYSYRVVIKKSFIAVTINDKLSFVAALDTAPWLMHGQIWGFSGYRSDVVISNVCMG